MPRPILKTEQGSKPITTSTALPSAGSLEGARLQQRLRQRRTKPYVDTLCRLRIQAFQPHKEALNTVLRAVEAEFPELAIQQRPSAILGQVRWLDSAGQYHRTAIVALWDVSKRRLDQPEGFEFLTEDAIAVYEPHQAMPTELLERARTLALHFAYDFVELYPDTLRAVATDGSVSVIEK